MDERLAAFQREALAAMDGVYRFARQLTQDAADSEDLVQDTYLRAFQNHHRYRLGTNCTAWLFTICRNLWVQKRQREERMTPYSDGDLEDLASAKRGRGGRVDELPATLERPEFDAVLQRALAAIPETYRTPVLLIDTEDHTYATAAEVLGVPIGTIRSRLFRGRRLLQEHLIAYAEDAGLVSASPRPRADPRRWPARDGVGNAVGVLPSG